MQNARARILILTAGPLCRNPRVLKEAQTLGAAGFDVTAMTVANIERFEAYDREILKTASFKKVALDQLSNRLQVRASVFSGRMGTWLARQAAGFGIQSARAFGPIRPLSRMARNFSADLTIVHSELPLCIGHELLQQGRRVATDFEDWHSQDLLPDARSARPLRLIQAVERNLMQRSAYTSTTSAAMAAGLQKTYGGPMPAVLMNSFPLQPDPARFPRPGPPALFWFSQTIGPGRGLELFIAAWRRTAHPSRLCLLGDVGNSYRAKLLNRLPPGRREHLEFLPITAPEDLPTVIARHDIGLALEASIPANKDLTVSNKILQYLNAGIGVIASGTAGQREVLDRAPDAGYITNLNETSDLTALLDSVLADPGRIAAMGAAARRLAEEHFCWEKEEPRLIALVTAALKASAP